MNQQLMRSVMRARAPKKNPLRGFGSAMQHGQGVAFREGSLGIPPYEAQAGGMGSPMQRGQGTAFREGSLGAALSLSNDNMIFLAIGGILGIVAVKQGWVKKGFLGT